LFRERLARSRWPFAGAAIVLAALAAAWYVLARDGEGEVAPVEDGALVEALAGSWQRINPLFAGLNEADQDISALVFSGLVRNGPDGLPQPDLADLPEVSGEGRVLTFRLRPGLRWHDGEPLTSADVAFTIRALVDPDFRGPAALAEPWTTVKVETPDDRTVVLTLVQPLASFTARFATVGILPRHLLEGLTAQQLFEAPFNQAPVGSGPYRLVSLNAEEAVLEAFAGYHLGAPLIPRLRFRLFPDYPSATAALAAGTVDTLMVREPLTSARLAELQSLKDVTLLPYQRTAYLVLYLNNDQALFSDPRVRRAISLAVDREELAHEGFGGVATASDSLIAPGSWAYAPNFDLTDVRLAEAAALLDDAGWVLSARTGVRTREGVEFRFTIRVDNDARRTAIASAIASDLEPLGVRATVASTTFLVLQRDFLRERRYDAAIAGWDQGADPDPYFGWHSSQLGTAALNLANFQDVVSDELIGAARTTHDLAVRKDLYRQFQERWTELAPSVVLLYPQFLYAVRGKLAGMEPVLLVTPASRFYDVHRWTR
jgi:peptide/nickel transport system substrate-binding protein